MRDVDGIWLHGIRCRCYSNHKKKIPSSSARPWPGLAWIRRPVAGIAGVAVMRPTGVSLRLTYGMMGALQSRIAGACWG